MPRYTLWFTRLPWLKQQHLPFNQQLLGGEVPIHKQVGHNYRGHISQLFQTYQCHDYVIVAMNTLRKSRVAMDNYDSCLLIKDFPWILPPLTTKNWGPPSVWTFAPWHPRPWPSKGLEHGPRRQKSGCNFWDVLQWHAMTMSWDMKSMDFWQCKHEFNIIMSKKNGRTTDDVAWVCSVDFHGEKPLHAHPLSKHIYIYLDLWTIVNTIKKPKSMSLTICTWAFIMRTLPFLVLDMLIVLAYSIPVSRGNLRWHGLWTMEPLPLHLPQIFIRILTNCRRLWDGRMGEVLKATPWRTPWYRPRSWL